MRGDGDYHDDGGQWLRLQKSALAFARRWLRTADDVANDIAQEAVLCLLERRNAVRNPTAWLFVVTRRLCSQHRKRQQLGDCLPSTYVSTGSEQMQAVDPSWFEARLDLQIDLHSLLGDRRLTVRDRRILFLLLVGCTHSEIAGRLGCSRGVTAQYVCRCLRRMRMIEARDGSQRSGFPPTGSLVLTDRRQNALLTHSRISRMIPGKTREGSC